MSIISSMVTTDQGFIFETLRNDGWVFLKPPLTTNIADLVRSLGRVMPNRRTGSSFADLVPYAICEAPERSMSSLVGKSPQPMHSDGAFTPEPPRYLLFECLEEGEGKCPTHISTLNEADIISEQPKLLTTPQWVFDNGVDRGFYGAVFERVNSLVRVRFDPFCMSPASFSQYSVTDAETVIDRYTQHRSVDWVTGAILMIDNWRCLHARGAGSDNSPSRRLRRWQIG